MNKGAFLTGMVLIAVGGILIGLSAISKNVEVTNQEDLGHKGYSFGVIGHYQNGKQSIILSLEFTSYITISAVEGFSRVIPLSHRRFYHSILQKTTEKRLGIEN